jgi:DNA-binding SARP family transcriptional activator
MHQMMGLGHALRGETDAALVAMDASIAVARAGGDRWMEAVMIARRALANAMGGRGDAALADYGSAVPLLRNVGEMWFLSLALEGMAAVELGRGSIVAAAEHARESIAVLRAEPDPWFISRSLDTLASIAASGLRPDTELGVARAAIAARLSAAASALRSRRGAEVMESDKERRVTTIAAARAALGETEFRESWELGEALDLTAVFTLAESVDVAPPSAEKPEPRQTPSAANTGRPPALSVEVFGPLIVARDGVPLAPGELPAGKATEMLLYLLLHPEGRTKDQIGLALWPDASAGQIRASFHVILHHLRRALGGSDRDAGTQWITFSDGRYRLLREAASRTAIDAGSRIELDSDVDAIFAAAEVLRRAELREEALDPGTLDVVAEALARRRGELGEGLATGDWLLAHADRLGRVWRDGMEALARQFLRIGRNSEAEVALDALISDEPLREGAHRELMALWAATGERARALAHYDTLVSLLRREVGALPDRETQLLAERIRRE